MSSKYKNFQISNYIIIGFLILISLALNYILMGFFGFNQNLFIPITGSIVIVGLLLYRYLSQSLFLEFFKSDEDIDNMVKKTLHELNTPVATIEMNVNMLEKKITDEKDIKRLKRIKDSCDNLLELYNKAEYEITSKIDKIKKESFDIKEIIEKSLLKIEDIKKDITIKNKIKSQIITADKYGFEVMIDNLLSNAIKYNKHDGFICLENNNHTLKVSDTGKGIDTKHILQIYDKYFQIDVGAKGIGLGLSIVKEYCDNNKIDIKIDSITNKGTTFSLNYKALI